MTDRPGGPHSVEDPDDFDDLPSTHLEDDEYEAFLRRELDAEGRPRESLPVTAILVALIVVVLALAFVVLGG